jgi:hypothetical protein
MIVKRLPHHGHSHIGYSYTKRDYERFKEALPESIVRFAESRRSSSKLFSALGGIHAVEACGAGSLRMGIVPLEVGAEAGPKGHCNLLSWQFGIVC